MEITIYDEAGNETRKVIALTRQSALSAGARNSWSKGFLPDVWKIQLDNGKNITERVDNLDKHYQGWRDLRQIP
jgi:hypothetical protein